MTWLYSKPINEENENLKGVRQINKMPLFIKTFRKCHFL